MRDFLNDSLASALGQGSVAAIGIAFLLGIFVGFSPCIYPVLPLTVSYIGSISKGRKLNGFLYSLLYVLGMAVVYCTLGVIGATVGGLRGLWGNGWVLLGMANFFLLLAMWQLGVIHIRLPQFAGNSRKSGALGVGAAAGLIVGPCTVPGLAAMLTLISTSAARNGNAANVGALLFGITAMFAYSLGLGSLILICGTFSGVLTNLPRSGRWLNVMEKVFAVVMILLAEFFLVYLGQNARFPLLANLFG